MPRRFWNWNDLAYERRCALASEQTVAEAIALYENGPRPLAEIDAIRLAGLQEARRVHHGQAAALQRSHHRARMRRRARVRPLPACHGTAE